MNDVPALKEAILAVTLETSTNLTSTNSNIMIKKDDIVKLLDLIHIGRKQRRIIKQNIIYTIRDECFKHVHSLPLRYFDTHPVGRIVTRITNDVESLHELYANSIHHIWKKSKL